MANLPESSTWESGIFQIETNTPVKGGVNGESNTQAKQLSNRTKYLYDNKFNVVGGDLTGSAGLGYIGILPQSSNPSTPASGVRIFANNDGMLSWKTSDGYTKSITGTLTADRSYDLPDYSGKLGVYIIDTWSNLVANHTPTSGRRARATDGTGFDVIGNGQTWIPDYTARINVQSGTTYTITDEDNGSVIRFTNNSPITLTVNTEQAIIGFNCIIEQAGTGQITLGGTATKNNIYDATRSAGQHAVCSLFCSVAGSFNFSGDVV